MPYHEICQTCRSQLVLQHIFCCGNLEKSLMTFYLPIEYTSYVLPFYSTCFKLQLWKNPFENFGPILNALMNLGMPEIESSLYIVLSNLCNRGPVKHSCTAVSFDLEFQLIRVWQNSWCFNKCRATSKHHWSRGLWSTDAHR